MKERPDAPYRDAVEDGCRIVYMPVDFYGSHAQLDADAPFLASCSALLVHSRRLGRLLAGHNPAVWQVDHPNLHGLPERPPYRPEGFRLWVGDLLNLPYLLRWCEETGQPRESLRILTNARRTSVGGVARTISLARRLGVELDLGRERVNGIPMAEWDPATQRELMASAKAALDVKGGDDDFAQYTKPPTKAHQFVASGIPFAANREASAVEDLLEDGFELADPGDEERWLSREYWRATQEYAARLEERIRPEAVAALYRRCLDGVLERSPAARAGAVGPRPSGPPPVAGGRLARLRVQIRAARSVRAAGGSLIGGAPALVQTVRASFRDLVPGFVRCRQRDARAARPAIEVSVLLDLAAPPAEAWPAGQVDGVPETWEIVASRSLRVPGAARVRLKSLARWPSRGLLRDRNVAAAHAEGRYLAFVPRLGADELAWVGAAAAALEANPETALVRRDEPPGRALDPAATFAVRRDVWVVLRGYERDASLGSPRCGDLALLQRIRQLGYRDEVVPGEEAVSVALPRPAPRESGGIVVYTAITNGFDSLLELDERCVGAARRVAFLDGPSRALAGGPRGWELREIDWRAPDPNRLAKLPKIRPERFFPEAEYSLWLDGNVVLTSPFDLARLIELYLQKADLCVFAHHARSCAYAEAEACKARRLDDPALIDAQVARYRDEGLPERFGLHELPVVLRRHSAAVAEFDRLWWEEISRGSRRDQLSFQYVRWKTGLPVAEFPLRLQRPNGLFAKVPHRARRPSRLPDTTRLRAGLRRLEGVYFGSTEATR